MDVQTFKRQRVASQRDSIQGHMSADASIVDLGVGRTSTQLKVYKTKLLQKSKQEYLQGSVSRGLIIELAPIATAATPSFH